MDSIAVTSSGRQTASVVVSAAAGRLHGLVVETDGTNAATVTVYDNASASATGNIVGRLIVAGADRNANIIFFEQGVEALRGLYLEVTGTGAAAIVYYSRG